MAAKKTTTKKKKATKKGVTISSFAVAIEPNNEHGVVATWTQAAGESVKKKKSDKKKSYVTESYTVDWEYTVGSGWIGNNSQTYGADESRVGTGKTHRVEWTAPSNATAARARVTPVAQKKDDKNNTSYYTGGWSDYKEVDFRTVALPTPSISVSIDANTSKATVTVSSSDVDVRSCNIRAYCGASFSAGTKRKEDNGIAWNGGATKVYTVNAGETWAFEAQTATSQSKAKSSWSTPQSATAKPAKPAVVEDSNKAVGEDGIQMKWAWVTGATSFTVEYVADDKTYFDDNRSAVITESGLTGTTFTKPGLEAGHTWYMRVQAVNDAGTSAWSDVLSVKISLTPDVPTTYDTEPSFKRTDSARMRWTHNCEGRPDQTAAQVQMKLSTQEDSSATTTNVNSSDMFLVKALSSYADGSIVMWRVRTKADHTEWSPWSVWRQFTVYDVPTLACSLSQPAQGGSSAVGHGSSPLASLPLTVELEASGGGGSVIGYHIAISAYQAVDTIGIDGDTYGIPAGEVLYEADYTTSDNPFEAEVGIDAGLPDASVLSITADAMMASGLRVSLEAPVIFNVDFASDVPDPDVMVTFDPDELVALVGHSCYVAASAADDPDYELAENVIISVYRIEADNSLTLIEGDLPNTDDDLVDPHACFGECWYRVVVTSTVTGMTSYADGYAKSVHQTCCVQWDESWDTEGGVSDDGVPYYAYTGSRIDGLYNLNLDESYGIEAEDAEYIGRKHPVSYYGTQRGHRASYAVEFPKSDTTTLAKCRRLMDYAGDVYVREPSGLGFWARVDGPSIGRGYDTQAVRFSFTAIHVDHPEKAVL